MSKFEKGSIGYFLELAKKDGFDNIKDWNEWRKKTGKMPDATEIERENKRRLAQNKGYKNHKEYVDNVANIRGYKNDAERQAERNWNRGFCSPISGDIESNNYLAIHIAERDIAKKILSIIFKDVIEMPCKNPGYDFLCKNPIHEFINKHPIFKLSIDKEYKIDVKSSRLCHNNQWIFHIKYNYITDYFLPIGFNNEYDEDKLEAMYAWFFKKDEIIRNRKFYQCEGFGIANRPYYLSKFNIYELKNELEEVKKSLRKDKFG